MTGERRMKPWMMFCGLWVVLNVGVPVPALCGDDIPERSYAVGLIDPSLRKDAHVVVRDDIMVIDVQGRSKGTIMVRWAVTVFDAKGKKAGRFSQEYDRFWKLKDFDGVLLDGDGKEIRSLRKEEVHDQSSVSSFSLYEDARVRTAEIVYDQFPYTVVFTAKESFDGCLGWPTSIAQGEEHAVEYFRYEIRLPAGEQLRYITSRNGTSPVVSNGEYQTTYVWEARNLPKLTPEEMEEDFDQRALFIKTAPSLFQMDGVDGDMRDWGSFGIWRAQLYSGRDVLPDPLKREVHALVDSLKTPREKIDKLYRYLQERTRYVSIQLGIGGWQPFDASFVYEKGYGDCKALSNYMVALLKEAGIVAYPVVINAGAPLGPMYREDFPSSEFNHVIACVPLGKDSVWLECTSDVQPAGQLGDFTENRFGLLVAPDGGHIVHTPASHAADNVQERTVRVELSFTGRVEGTVMTKEYGNHQFEIRAALRDETPEEQTKWVQDHLGVPNAEVKDLVLKGFTTPVPDLSFAYRVTIPRYASNTNNRLFFQPNLARWYSSVPKEVKQRRSPVRFEYPDVVVDSNVYKFPKDYTIEALPADVHIKASFGSYSGTMVKTGDSGLVYVRRVEFRDWIIPPEKYQEYRSFLADMIKADRAQVVLVKKEPE